MTLDVSGVLPYGPLERTEVFFEHDGPRLFALRSRTLDVHLIAVCTDEDEDTVKYLYLVLSPARFNDVRSGHVGLRDAFEAAGPWSIWRVVERYDSVEPYAEAQSVAFRDIPDDDLPTVNARLELSTPTAPGLDPKELRGQASSSLRTYVAVELDAFGENLTEFPLKGLGQVGGRFQESIDALAQEVAGRPTERGAIPGSITDDVQMNVVGLRAASFVVVLATDKRGALMDNGAKVESTLGHLLDLVDKAHEPHTLVAALRGHGPRARSKVVGLLRAVAQAESGLGVYLSPQQSAPRGARLTAREVSAAMAVLDAVEPAENDVHVRRGILLGSNTERSTFLLFDAARGQTYSGKVAEPARGQIDGLRVGHQSYIQADLLEKVEFSATEQEGGRSYTLIQIAERSETRADADTTIPAPDADSDEEDA